MAFVQLVSRLDDLTEYVRTISVASDIGIKILGNASQSDDHFRVADSTDTTFHFKIDLNGNAGFGVSPSNSNVHISRIRTDTSGTQRCLRVLLTTQPGANSAANFRAGEFILSLDQGNNYTGVSNAVLGSVQHIGAGTVTQLTGTGGSIVVQGGGSVGTAFGVQGSVQIASVASTITNAIGFQAAIFNSVSGGAITTSAGFEANTPNLVAGATIGTNRGLRIRNQGASGITTSYGIFLDAQTGATTTNAIWSDGGQSTLKTGASGTIALVVQGASSQVADLQDWNDVNGNVNARVMANGSSAFKPRDAVTNAITTALQLGHNSSGTPAAGFGSQIQGLLKSSTTEDRSACELSWEWVTATDASRKARVKLSVYDTAVRECIRAEADGSNPMLGVLGAAAVTRQTVTGSRGGNAALASFLTAMANFGWITDSTTA